MIGPPQPGSLHHQVVEVVRWDKTFDPESPPSNEARHDYDGSLMPWEVAEILGVKVSAVQAAAARLREAGYLLPAGIRPHLHSLEGWDGSEERARAVLGPSYSHLGRRLITLVLGSPGISLRDAAEKLGRDEADGTLRRVLDQLDGFYLAAPTCLWLSEQGRGLVESLPTRNAEERAA